MTAPSNFRIEHRVENQYKASAAERGASEAEARVIADLAAAAADPTIIHLDDDHIVVTTPSGNIHWDLTPNLPAPRRKTGVNVFNRRESFVEFLAMHDTGRTTITGNPKNSEFSATLDDHSKDGPGWKEFRADLIVEQAEAWKAWMAGESRWILQSDFAEIVEDRLQDFIAPGAADMLELSQDFQAAKSATFEEGIRLDNGAVQLAYKETVTARAGRTGQLEIPQRFTINIPVYEGEERYDIACRFRYRISDEHRLMVQYTMIDRSEILRRAFDDLADLVETQTKTSVWQ